MINVIFDDAHYKADEFFKSKPQKYLEILKWGRKYPCKFAE